MLSPLEDITEHWIYISDKYFQTKSLQYISRNSYKKPCWENGLPWTRHAQAFTRTICCLSYISLKSDRERQKYRGSIDHVYSSRENPLYIIFWYFLISPLLIQPQNVWSVSCQVFCIIMIMCQVTLCFLENLTADSGLIKKIPTYSFWVEFSFNSE